MVAEEVAVVDSAAVELPVAAVEEHPEVVLHAVSLVELPVEDLVEASEEVVEASKELLHTQKSHQLNFIQIRK